jgi:broad specificity phosphatase PhoE
MTNDCSPFFVTICTFSLCFLIQYKVLNRIENSFNSFVEMTSSKPRRDIVAVSHGQFIRMMLAVALDMPLFQAFTTIQQKNACINILDISYTEKVTRRAKNCNLFGGPLLSRITDDNLTIVLPKISVVCIGETRHLQGLEVKEEFSKTSSEN